MTDDHVLREERDRALAELEAMRRTLSWRMTVPLRHVRRWQRRGEGRHEDAEQSDVGTFAARQRLTADSALRARVHDVTNVLTGSVAGSTETAASALRAFGAATEDSGLSSERLAWLGLVATDGAYPTASDVDATARSLRMHGPDAFTQRLAERFAERSEAGRASHDLLHVVPDAVLVDVTDTVGLGLSTGIQRVVRETVARWIGRELDMTYIGWDAGTRSMRCLDAAGMQRLVDWRATIAGEPSAPVPPSTLEERVLVPWGCRMILPEFVLDIGRSMAHRSLVDAGVLSSLSVVGYDLVPVIAPETTFDGMSDLFLQYLTIVKRAHRVVAISDESRRAFVAFGELCRAEGRPAPAVEVCPLPADPPPVDETTGQLIAEELGVSAEAPLVLVVGTHEPRKNHVAVLEAAAGLWASGWSFSLCFVGGTAWGAEAFEALAAELAGAGRPIRVRRGLDEARLWAAYRAARFTVFPSLLEGFGLPIVESLACGTPVITSRHGSMADVAAAGGCLLVDPRRPDAIADAMRQLLDDDALHARLVVEARARPARRWDDYADEVWRLLTTSP